MNSDKTKSQNTSEINEPSDQTERPTTKYQKPLYSSVLKMKSNANLWRKLGKQNLAYNDNNDIKQTVLDTRTIEAQVETDYWRYLNKQYQEKMKNRVFKTKSLPLKKKLKIWKGNT